MFTVLVLPLLASLVAAQQNMLVDGNSQLPQCARQCTLLQQANAACAATGSPQAAWTCFCQSAYLTPLYNTAVGVCDAFCTDTAQNAQISTWYKSNCGTDLGGSEHAEDATSAATTTSRAANAAATTADPPAPAATNNAGSDPGSAPANSGSERPPNVSSSSSEGGSWWSGHYRWIIMVIVLAIGFSLLAWLLMWLKRRHDRKQDIVKGGFNAGVTERSTPATGGNEEKNASSLVVTPMHGSGRNSPARTREAFMPYGYGYARSESRLTSNQTLNQPTSPLATDAISDGLGAWPAAKGISRGK